MINCSLSNLARDGGGYALYSCHVQSVLSSGDDLSPIFQNFILSFRLASCQMHPCTCFRPPMICCSIRISFVLVAILSRKCSKCRWRRLVNCHLQLLPLLRSVLTFLTFAQIGFHIFSCLLRSAFTFSSYLELLRSYILPGGGKNQNASESNKMGDICKVFGVHIGKSGKN